MVQGSLDNIAAILNFNESEILTLGSFAQSKVSNFALDSKEKTFTFD